MSARKILIDTDPGVDDAMAIFYALASPELDVVGLTTVFGNADIDTCTVNALRLLEIAQRSDIPVARGAHRPLALPTRGHPDVIHGADGQGNTFLPPATTAAVSADAARFIVDTVRAAPGEITLVPIGPLTNIALALLAAPDLAESLAGIVLMGGAAFVSGNASPTAEANILGDPDAADIVFGANCLIVMCGLDVTEQTVMPPAALDRIAAATNARARHITRILPLYADFNRSKGIDGIYIHDSTVISYLIAPWYYDTVVLPVRVDCGHSFGRGKTFAGDWPERPPVTICTSVDSAAVVELELERLTAIR